MNFRRYFSFVFFFCSDEEFDYEPSRCKGNLESYGAHAHVFVFIQRARLCVRPSMYVSAHATLSLSVYRSISISTYLNICDIFLNSYASIYSPNIFLLHISL